MSPRLFPSKYEDQKKILEDEKCVKRICHMNVVKS